ncbi:MAG: hypothetical protein CSB28_02500, partial [Desulfobacterales bacterium]
QVEIYGTEISSDTKISERLNLGLSYVYTRARNTSEKRKSDLIEDVPEHQAIAKISYLIPGIETTLNVNGSLKIDNVIDDRDETLEDSFVIDVSLLKTFTSGLTLGGYVSNLLDEDYYEGNGMASNGINFKVLARYEF